MEREKGSLNLTTILNMCMALIIFMWDWEKLYMLLVQISTILLEEKLTWVSIVHKNIKNNSGEEIKEYVARKYKILK